MTTTEMNETEYDTFLQSSSKEQLIKLLTKQVIVGRKKELRLLDDDYNLGFFTPGCDGAFGGYGAKVYYKEYRNEPRQYVGTIRDPNKLSREQLLQAIENPDSASVWDAVEAMRDALVETEYKDLTVRLDKDTWSALNFLAFCFRVPPSRVIRALIRQEHHKVMTS
jgi:hypothetical protein